MNLLRYSHFNLKLGSWRYESPFHGCFWRTTGRRDPEQRHGSYYRHYTGCRRHFQVYHSGHRWTQQICWRSFQNGNYWYILLNNLQWKLKKIKINPHETSSLNFSIDFCVHCVVKDHCETNPCLHGGTCTDTKGWFNCTCRTGYGGPRCEFCEYFYICAT